MITFQKFVFHPVRLGPASHRYRASYGFSVCTATWDS